VRILIPATITVLPKVKLNPHIFDLLTVAESEQPARNPWATFLAVIEKSLGRYEWFATFTFSTNPHPEQAERRYFRFVREINETLYGRRFRERGKGVFHIRATERQKRGAVHFHSLMGGGVSVLNPKKWQEIWRTLEVGNGFSRIYPYDPRRGALSYLQKYVAKGGELDIFCTPSQFERVKARCPLSSAGLLP